MRRCVQKGFLPLVRSRCGAERVRDRARRSGPVNAASGDEHLFSFTAEAVAAEIRGPVLQGKRARNRSHDSGRPDRRRRRKSAATCS